jgi:hypothetical protein
MAINRIDTSNPDGVFDQFIEWSDNPTEGPLPLTSYSDAMAAYDYGDFKVSIDLSSEVILAKCKTGSFAGDFDEGADVLLGTNSGSNLPIHLTFDRPISALGAFVSPDGPRNLQYIRKMGVKVVGQNDWIPLVRTAAFLGARKTATFLGAESTNGTKITEVWFDVVNVPGNVAKVRKVAIGNLYFSV